MCSRGNSHVTNELKHLQIGQMMFTSTSECFTLLMIAMASEISRSKVWLVMMYAMASEISKEQSLACNDVSLIQ